MRCEIVEAIVLHHEKFSFCLHADSLLLCHNIFVSNEEQLFRSLVDHSTDLRWEYVRLKSFEASLFYRYDEHNILSL